MIRVVVFSLISGPGSVGGGFTERSMTGMKFSRGELSKKWAA